MKKRAWVRSRSSIGAMSVLSLATLALFPWPASSQKSAGEGKLSAPQLRKNLTTRDFSGEPIDLFLSDASLQEVVSRLGNAGGIRLDLDPTIEDKVSYHFRQMPWDEALATVLADNDLYSDIDGTGNSLKIFRGQKSVLVFNNPAKLRRFLFFYGHAPEILAAGLILLGGGIGWRIRKRARNRDGPVRRKPLLSAEDAERVTKRLESLLDVEKVYRRDDLSLASLADEVSVTPHQLSWLINHVLGVSYTDLVNGHRVAEVRERLSDPTSNHTSLLRVALEAGFNSKAAFNRAFKRHTGLTPSQYKTRNGSGWPAASRAVALEDEGLSETRSSIAQGDRLGSRS